MSYIWETVKTDDAKHWTNFDNSDVIAPAQDIDRLKQNVIDRNEVRMFIVYGGQLLDFPSMRSVLGTSHTISFIHTKFCKLFSAIF